MKNPSLNPRLARKITRGYKRSLESEDSDRSEGSCDSGVGLDHQAEVQLATRENSSTSLPYTFEEETNSEFCFTNMPGRGRGASNLSLSAAASSTSRDGRVSLAIIAQPETQHRARYQTEGSRGAVKDRTGNGFPMVKLSGYNKPATLHIFIGTDVGRVTPHMFYQACRVSGKNSTPCLEQKQDGTVVIAVDLDPSKDMVVTCDCVGILKERNVDVEHRFPDQTAARNKKKSTRCRMVFRTLIQNDDGTTEWLQVCSHQIVCTQPPGVPELCKKSLTSCPASGGLELFILGKNFLKDTRVVFRNADIHPPWEETVFPDKEFLQQNHLVCVVPSYKATDITEPVSVKMFVTSSGKASDPHSFVYLPINSQLSPTSMATSPCPSFFSGAASSAFVNGNRILALMPNDASQESNSHEMGNKEGSMMWATASQPPVSHDEETMMPPPSDLPLPRRPSFHVVSEKDEFKAEVMDELSQSSMSCDRDSSLSPNDVKCVDLSMKPSMLCHLVDVPITTSAAPMTKQFPVLYENQPFVDESMLRPPPSKMMARDFVDGGLFEAKNDVDMGEPRQTGFGAIPRVRSGSFSHSSTLGDKSTMGFDTFSRGRSASMSHSFGPKASLISQAASSLYSSSCRNKDVDYGASSMVKQAALKMQPALYSMPPTCSSGGPSHHNQGSVMPTPPLLNTTITSSGALDAIVNSAADSHMGADAPMSVSPPAYTGSQVLRAFDTAPSAEPVIVPITVAELARGPHRIGDMFVPAGPAPPITGMVTQEMVKMTDNDLIGFINPNAFDQVKLEVYDAP